MGDEHSFYIILLAFYLIECCALARPDSIAFRSRLIPGKPWRPQKESLRLMGLKKWLFRCPLLPWPQAIIIVPMGSSASIDIARINTARRVRSLTTILAKATAKLRLLSLFVFAYFTLGLPFAYYAQSAGDNTLLFALITGYGLTLATSFVYFSVHRRLLPKESGDRWKSTLYTAFLPWHCMRCSDEIFLKYADQWSYPATLAAHAEEPHSRQTLLALWREAHFLPSPRYRSNELEPILESAQLSTTDWDQPPTQLETPKYCPCCHTQYESSATHCADCQRVELKSGPAGASRH